MPACCSLNRPPHELLDRLIDGIHLGQDVPACRRRRGTRKYVRDGE